MPLAVYVLGLGIFSMTTSEFMVSGMLPLLASAFGVSVGTIGYLISAYAFGLVTGGPFLAFGLLRFNKRTTILVLLAVYALDQALGALAPTYSVLMLSRLIGGVASAAYFGAALSICSDLVPENKQGKASSVVLSGLVASTVVGLPLATYLGEVAGWRASFWVVAGLTTTVGLLAYRLVPSGSAPEAVSTRRELDAFRNRHLWRAYASSALVVASVFAAFSFFAPILTAVTGFSESALPGILALAGLAGLIGTLAVGRVADAWTIEVQVIGMVLLAASMMLFVLGVENPLLVVIAIVLIGLVGISMNPAMVTRVMRVGGGKPLINTVHSSVLNTGVLVGSWVGGLAIHLGFGLTSPLWAGAVFALMALLSLVVVLNCPEDGARRVPSTTR